MNKSYARTYVSLSFLLIGNGCQALSKWPVVFGKALQKHHLNNVQESLRASKQRKHSATRINAAPGTFSNIISGNGGNAILINNQSNNNTIQNNLIGVTPALAPAGNERDGLLIENNSNNNLIGGTTQQNGNVIAFNKKGVVVGENKCDQSVGNSIIGNSIYQNTCIGIDLADNGITPNHKKNPTSGPNNFQNFPVIKSATSSETQTTIHGTLMSVPNSNFLIEFFSNPEKNEEGRIKSEKSLSLPMAREKLHLKHLDPPCRP